MSGGLDYIVLYPYSSDLFTYLFDHAREGKPAKVYAKRTDQIGGIPELFTVSVDKINFRRPVTFEVVDQDGRRFLIDVPTDGHATFTIYV